jgi:16S rRNA (cytidine1402-2'-O)-methyltransferase
MVFFESPRRLAVTLKEMAAAFGPGRPAAVCRELTKTHEEIKRGTLGEVANWAAAGVLGEITVVVGGATKDEAAGAGATIAEAVERVAEAERAGLSRREAVAAVAAETGLRRRAVYNAVLAGHPGRVG